MRRWLKFSEVGLAVAVIARGTPMMRMMMDRWERKNLLGFWVWVQRNEKLLVASASPWREPPQSFRQVVGSGIKCGCGFWRFGAGEIVYHVVYGGLAALVLDSSNFQRD